MFANAVSPTRNVLDCPLGIQSDTYSTPCRLGHNSHQDKLLLAASQTCPFLRLPQLEDPKCSKAVIASTGLTICVHICTAIMIFNIKVCRAACTKCGGGGDEGVCMYSIYILISKSLRGQELGIIGERGFRELLTETLYVYHTQPLPLLPRLSCSFGVEVKLERILYTIWYHQPTADITRGCPPLTSTEAAHH